MPALGPPDVSLSPAGVPASAASRRIEVVGGVVSPRRSLPPRSQEEIRQQLPPCRVAVSAAISRRGTEHGSGLDTQRWERAFAHLYQFRRLRIRWEVRDDIHEAFLILGCALICWRRLNPSHQVFLQFGVAPLLDDHLVADRQLPRP